MFYTSKQCGRSERIDSKSPNSKHLATIVHPFDIAIQFGIEPLDQLSATSVRTKTLVTGTLNNWTVLKTW